MFRWSIAVVKIGTTKAGAVWRAAMIAGMAAAIAVAVGTARAENRYFSQVYLYNAKNGNGDAGTANFNNPTAATDGAVWLDTGGGPQLNKLDFNLSIEVKVSGGSWTTLATALVSDSSGMYDVSRIPNIPWSPIDPDPSGIYDYDRGSSNPKYASGYFGRMGALGYAVDIPGSYDTAVLPEADFRFRAWTGNYASYPAAAAASATGAADAFVGSIQFTQTQFDFGPIDTSQYGFTDMPALVMAQGWLPGDANHDYAVDMSDLSIVLTNFDKTNMTWSQGDFTYDGTTDIADLSIVLANYDRTVRASGGIKTVPEPSTLVLLGTFVMGLLAYSYRRRS
jgi:hypothetical protein